MGNLPVRTIILAIHQIIDHNSHITLKQLSCFFRQSPHFIYVKPHLVYVFPHLVGEPPFLKQPPDAMAASPSFVPPVKYQLNNGKSIPNLSLILLPVNASRISSLPQQHLTVHPGLVRYQIHQPDPPVNQFILA